MLPSVVVEKKYIEEITRLLKLWIQDSPLKTFALKARIRYISASLFFKSKREPLSN